MTIFLSRNDVEQTLRLDDVFEVVRETYLALECGEATLFPIVRESLHDSLFGLRSGSWPDRKLLGVKVSGYYARNAGAGLDNHQSTIVLLDPANGLPRAIVDGNHVTWLRTAAASAIASLALAREDARKILIVGAGLQAEAQAVAYAAAFASRDPEFVVVSTGPRADPARARIVTERIASRHGVDVRAGLSLREELSSADIVVTVTPSTDPILDRAHLAPGTHVAAMGSDAVGKRELDARILRDARIVVDHEQAFRLGEAQYLDESGRRRVATLGAVLAGAQPGRTSPTELTVFDSTGLALHDLAVADRAVELSRPGSRIEL